MGDLRVTYGGQDACAPRRRASASNDAFLIRLDDLTPPELCCDVFAINLVAIYNNLLYDSPRFVQDVGIGAGGYLSAGCQPRARANYSRTEGNRDGISSKLTYRDFSSAYPT